MAAPPSMTLLLLLLASSLPFLLLSLYIKRRLRRRSDELVEGPGPHPIGPPLHRDLPEWLPPPPPPLPLQCGDANAASAPAAAASGEEREQRSGEEKRRKKKGRKKRAETRGGLDGGEDDEGCSERSRAGKAGAVEVGCPYPFSSFASATQRKIKLQYDQLVKSNQAKALTMAQVGQFVNCLVEARNELQHKSETIQRSFKIKKALLFKADRSSFDRLCQQIYKLEAEHKRLEEDAAVYNLLQEHLKLSPAYKTMLEIGANMEVNPTSDQAPEFSDISFEELLAQEKKDSFWQRYGKQRSYAS